MPDVTIFNISDGVKASWAAQSSLTAVIPATRVYFERAAENTALPYVVYTFDDVSAYFGGTEYFSGTKYVKVTRVNFAVVGTRATDWVTLAQAISDAFGFTATSNAAGWVIDNAVILKAMPEVEGVSLTQERVSGEDVLKYETSFTITMQADRG